MNVNKMKSKKPPTPSITNPCSPYPPVAVAIALAARSHALPGCSLDARARLALVVELGTAAAEWSEATRAAHAMREVDWLALARHLGEPLARLQRHNPAVLLARLDRREGRTL